MLDNFIAQWFKNMFLHLQTTDGQNSRSADQALGQFMIEVVGVKGEMKSDGSLTTSVILKDTVVDDKRKQKQEAGIKR